MRKHEGSCQGSAELSGDGGGMRAVKGYKDSLKRGKGSGVERGAEVDKGA